MPSLLKSKLKKHFNIQKATQITDSHCGPAVVQMLLSNLGIVYTQTEITQAAAALKTVNKNGTRVDQLARSVQKLAPQLEFWYKKNATLDDIRVILRKFELPVAVEWQGIFGQRATGRLDTDGHYSVVTKIDEVKRHIIMVDPYKDFELKDRSVTINRFARLWWDTNNYMNKETKQVKILKDTRLFFFLAPQNLEFPKKLKLKKGAVLIKAGQKLTG